MEYVKNIMAKQRLTIWFHNDKIWHWHHVPNPTEPHPPPPTPAKNEMSMLIASSHQICPRCSTVSVSLSGGRLVSLVGLQWEVSASAAQQGWGVLKVLSLISLLRKLLILKKIPVRILEPLSYLMVVIRVELQWCLSDMNMISGLIQGLRPANERRRYKVTASLIGWVQT